VIENRERNRETFASLLSCEGTEDEETSERERVREMRVGAG
jgi:hypothetical protein